MADPLPSWRQGPTRDAVVDFVHRVNAAEVPADERRPCSTTTAHCGARSRCRSSSISFSAGSSPWPRRDRNFRRRQPWQAAYERDYGWFAQLMTEHYAG